VHESVKFVSNTVNCHKAVELRVSRRSPCCRAQEVIPWRPSRYHEKLEARNVSERCECVV